MTKHDLFAIGTKAVYQFMDANHLERPEILTYEQARSVLRGRSAEYFRRCTTGAMANQGRQYGLYYDGRLFVNVPLTTAPVFMPAVRSWSWPGWKTDKTAVGVTAHEAGHYVEHALQKAKRINAREHGTLWRAGIADKAKGKKPVSGYEPVPSEAWAESMRLFILNPALLYAACPWRYGFILGCGLKPVARLFKQGWRKTLGNENYEVAAQRWIGA